MIRARAFLFVAAWLTVGNVLPAADRIYTQHQDVVFGDVHGVALVMDIFVPNGGKKNGHGIVDVASGAWHSDRGKIRDHERARMYDLMCGKGFTVFAVRPGSITKFSVPEMLENLNRGINWVKEHSTDYGVDPNALGLTGASAGGHLACLAAVTATDETRVKAVGVFFPPTDFLNYGGKELKLGGDGRIDRLVGRMAFGESAPGKSEQEVRDALTAISPARRVKGPLPPFLIFHGDADNLVPLQQSEVFVEALKKENVPVELVIKPGGGHPWLTIPVEVGKMADWFEKQLVAEQSAAK